MHSLQKALIYINCACTGTYKQYGSRFMAFLRILFNIADVTLPLFILFVGNDKSTFLAGR